MEAEYTDNRLVFTPSDFVAVLNQTLEYAYPSVTVEGEISNFKVSKGRWVYFDLKDERSSVKFFGTVYSLPGPLEDGMMVRVVGQPRLSQLYGFSVGFQLITPVGEGSINKAANLLEAKLRSEGLFDISRKRLIPHPPKRIGMVASLESAAYKDFIKVLEERWGGVEIVLADVQVQGSLAIEQIVEALAELSKSDLEVIVVTRGGGSADDLAVFSTEQVTRAVAGCRIPTLVAIGHERDVSLAELAADMRASTPSNAAELLVPDRKSELGRLQSQINSMDSSWKRFCDAKKNDLDEFIVDLDIGVDKCIESHTKSLNQTSELLEILNPGSILKRGYAVFRSGGKVIKSTQELTANDLARVQLYDGFVEVKVQ